jgi:hypothetical protein
MKPEPTPSLERFLDPSEVCLLPPAELTERLAWVRAEILPHATETIRLEDGLAIELRESGALAEQLDHWIALESECCAGITFERRSSANPGHLRFEIRGVDPNAALLQALTVPSRQKLDVGVPEPSSALRIAKAAGTGLTLSLLVCCVVPIAAAALLGAAAAPLAALDGPIPIAAGAVLGGAGAWLWLGGRARDGSTFRRRSSDEALGSGSDGCSPNC